MRFSILYYFWFIFKYLLKFQGNLYLSMNRPEIAVVAYRCAQELRADLRSYQGMFWKGTLSRQGFTSCNSKHACCIHF